MKIVNIIGGLGNQMFQYAFAKAVQAHNLDEKVYINALAFKGYGLHNGYEMDSLFKLDLPQAKKWDITRLYYPIFHHRIWQVANHWLPLRKNVIKEKCSMVFQPEVLTAAGDKYYDGYWQSYKYFEICKEDIRKIFTFPEIEDEKNRAFAEDLRLCNCVSVHVRRGDYLKDKDFGGITTETYYKNAIKKT